MERQELDSKYSFDGVREYFRFIAKMRDPDGITKLEQVERLVLPLKEHLVMVLVQEHLLVLMSEIEGDYYPCGEFTQPSADVVSLDWIAQYLVDQAVQDGSTSLTTFPEGWRWIETKQEAQPYLDTLPSTENCLCFGGSFNRLRKGDADGSRTLTPPILLME